jgi:hypothetical protein
MILALQDLEDALGMLSPPYFRVRVYLYIFFSNFESYAIQNDKI